MPGKAHNIRFYKPLFDHEKLPKYLLPTCMGTIFLACQGFLASRSNQGGTDPLTIYGPSGIEDFVKPV